MKSRQLKTAYIAFLAAGLPFTGYAGENTEEKLSLDKGTIENQFEYVINESSPYLEFKVVKTAWLQKLKAHVSDSINASKQQLNAMQKSADRNNMAMDSMVAEMQKVNLKLNKAIEEKNGIRFFGIIMDKAVYNSLMWSIIAILAVLLIVVITLFKRSNAITIRTTNDLKDIKKEYDDYRKKALEREEKIVRKMYDEILKYKNKTVKSKGTV